MIRKANKFDMDECVEMMRHYAAESPVRVLADPDNHDESHIRSIFTMLMAGRGFILIDDDYRGMLVAAIVQNLWCPKIKEVKELAWWVHPEHRDGMVGGKLLIAFEESAQELIADGRADSVAISLMETSPQIHLERRGFKKIEHTFVKEKRCQPH